ncbi:disease resistance protein RPV1-like isoform X2 [Eucalyptus grandis]|uniref:disease resistance protein RPV1-like isoform X2 n=1 Tax=Eucalyptus grandis TaxID=71139 RepID=UPI00192EB715|nr:disease resistance protein RPV1-like isoform X2 [Eucalyptus grandis]
MEWGAKRRRTGGNDGTAGGASSTHTSTEGQEVDNSSGYDYEVFLSFRGPDTRAGFTDFLYTSLKDASIHTFKDDEDLRDGVEFAPKLLQAIEQSKILIPIFSKDYASSVWCLKEVVQMVKCKKNGGKMIMPIFYDVAPSEVRYQTGNYKNSFLLHESKGRCDQKTIGEWKKALCQVGEINGWELPRDPTRRESKFVKEFTQKIFNELKKASLAVSDNLVSVDHHVEEIMEKIGAQTSETRIIGIHGMGGIGKTTLAKIIYNQLSKKFNNCCFLVNICEQAETNNGIISLQKKLILEVLKKKLTNIRDVDEGIQKIRKELSNEKVLVVLDDVDHKKHMDALVGNHNWFGKGSKLIITTRKKEVLKVPEVDDLYEVDIMDSEKSLQLFSKHAFRRDYPLDKDINQSMRAIKIAGGLPLALEVMGSFLSCIEREKWNSKLAKLESVPHADVRSKLKISYDVLEDEEKHIFLDIACLLIGYDKDIIVHFWKSKFHSENALDVLESMSLIKIKEDNKVWMHDQLRDLGRHIVQQINIKEKTRVWNAEEALELLKRQEKKKKLEALRLDLDHQHRFTYEDFKRLPNLRFLEVCSSKETFRAEERLFWHESPSSVLPINVVKEDSDLLQQLRWLAWHDIPPTFKITNFSMEDVVILDLSGSKITHDWKGWSHMKVMNNLKVMKLTNCIFLDRTPNFLAHSKLERLILQGCYN